MDFIKNSLNSIGKISLFVAMFFTLIGSSVAQINDPVKWSKHVVKISDSEYKLVLRGTLDHEWNIYSQYLVGEDGPQKTMIKFDKANAPLQGKIEEGLISEKNNSSIKFSNKYRGIFTKTEGKAFNDYIAKARNEWERDF